MGYARAKMEHFMPISADTVQTLGDEQIAALDQYIYRFTKWQDAMGTRLFSQSLQLLAEDNEPMAFIDKLNRLEKLGALRSATEWLDLRQLRNTPAHEYSDDAGELAEGINTLYAKLADIQSIASTFDQYIAPYLAGA